MYLLCLSLCLSISQLCGRAFAHDTVGHQINPSLWTHRAISRYTQCSMTGVTNAMACAVLSVCGGAYKRNLAANQKG